MTDTAIATPPVSTDASTGTLTLNFRGIGPQDNCVRLDFRGNLSAESRDELREKIKQHRLVRGVTINDQAQPGVISVQIVGKWDWLLWRTERLSKYCSRLVMDLLGHSEAKVRVHYPMPHRKRRHGWDDKTIRPRWRPWTPSERIEEYQLHQVM